MRELYEAVLAATKTAVNKEKDKGFSNTTFRMINQTTKLHQCLLDEKVVSSHKDELPPVITAE